MMALCETSLSDWHQLATQESVPAAFAVLALHPDDPWQACLTAASLGGDSDTIAVMAGAIAGACHGMTAGRLTPYERCSRPTTWIWIRSPRAAGTARRSMITRPRVSLSDVIVDLSPTWRRDG